MLLSALPSELLDKIFEHLSPPLAKRRRTVPLNVKLAIRSPTGELLDRPCVTYAATHVANSDFLDAELDRAIAATPNHTRRRLHLFRTLVDLMRGRTDTELPAPDSGLLWDLVYFAVRSLTTPANESPVVRALTNRIGGVAVSTAILIAYVRMRDRARIRHFFESADPAPDLNLVLRASVDLNVYDHDLPVCPRMFDEMVKRALETQCERKLVANVALLRREPGTDTEDEDDHHEAYTYLDVLRSLGRIFGSAGLAHHHWSNVVFPSPSPSE